MISRVYVILLVFCSGSNYTQVIVPQNIPCITVTQSNLPSLGSGIQATDCIITDGDVNFSSDENYSIRAGEYIEFSTPTQMNPDASHQFHAYIDNGGMEIAWYTPNTTPGTTGIFEKLELGVEFRSDIDQQIENFVNSTAGTQLNPFNPEQVDLYAEFWWYSDGSVVAQTGWFGPFRINGFYYEDYVRNSTDWNQQNTLHDFRIRFAPRMLGLWKCAITANVIGFGTFHASDFTFNVVDNGSKDFMSVGENGRYLIRGNEPFFPVGHNLSYPRPESGCCEGNTDFILGPEVFEAYEEQLKSLAENGANYVRIINNPMSTDVEFEKLNNYSDRMIHAWEMDNILNVAEQLGLLIHFDLLIQNYFDVPHAFGYNQWDWSATNDPGYNGTGCVAADDPGFCYRAELGLVDPKDFFSDPDAIKFYQYKLRYLIARYGYSNEIAVIELQSEVNNTSVYHPKELLQTGNLDINGNPIMGCYNIDDQVYNPYKENYPGYVATIFAWQHEMCRYIKEDLQHNNHPLAVSYTGPPDMANGDFTYESEFVDIITYNYYARSIDKWHNTKARVDAYNYVGKPFMFSEYGPGDGTHECDQGSDFIKTILLTPFTGVAGSAMNWEWQYPGEEFYWHYLGPVNDLMSGIKLDEENWQAGEPQTYEDNKVEMLYLYSEQDDNNQRKVVGAVSNRSYNYYTQSAVDPCHPSTPPEEVLLNPVYSSPSNVSNLDLDNQIEFQNMGINKQYHVEWFNALTGDFLLQQEYPSSLFGNLELSFPGILTGNEVTPILFFTIHPAGGSLKMSEQDTTRTERIIVNLPADTSVRDIKPTVWDNLSNQNNDLIIHVSPNPTSEILNVSIEEDNIENYQWYLISEKGDILISGSVDNKIFVVDIGSFESGTYYFVVENTPMNKVITKIVKV